MSMLTQIILIKALIAVIAVSGVFVLTGLTGMISLGQAAFMSIGAYVSGILVIKFGVSFPLAVLASLVAALILGFIMGIPTVGLRRDYVSLVSLGFGEALIAILNKMTKLTGGSNGLYGMPRLINLNTVAISATVAVALVVMYKNSKFGRQCIAVKSDELAAKAMGINVSKVKMTSLLLSVVLTAYAGCMYAFFILYIDPSLFAWKRSAEWITMVFFGGVNSLTGSVISAFFLTALPEFLRGFAQYRYMVYAIMVLLIINFKPNGVFGEFELSPSGIKMLIGNIKKFFNNTKKKFTKNTIASKEDPRDAA